MKGYGENSQPAATSDEYRKGYDKIFGKNEDKDLNTNGLFFEKCLDVSGDMFVEVQGCEPYTYINNIEAIKIIEHLKAVFEL